MARASFHEPTTSAGDLLSVVEMSDLIGSIYDCALNPSQWDRTLAVITAALNGNGAILSLNDTQADRDLIVKSAGWEPYWLNERSKHIAEIHVNLGGWRLQRPATDEPFVAVRDMSAASLQRSPTRIAPPT